MPILAIFVVWMIPALMFMAICGAGDAQYTPMTDDEEEAYLRRQGLSAEEIKEIMTPLLVPRAA